MFLGGGEGGEGVLHVADVNECMWMQACVLFGEGGFMSWWAWLKKYPCA